MDDTERLLKELTEASGVAGYETQVRAIMRRHLQPLGDISQDRLGSLICRSAGTAPEPAVMVAAHMDEIGFMVKLITPQGFIRFVALGGWPNQSMLSHRVQIETRKGNVTGVIGRPRSEFPATDEERKRAVERKDMYVDIGATSAEEVEAAGVRVGDPIVPVSDFAVLSNQNKTYMAKAFDDRVGCALVVELMRGAGRDHPNTLFGVGTVQEEVGTRGATTSVASVDPDVAIIVDVSPIGDIPGAVAEESTNKIGAGPALVNYDPHMIPNLKLRDMIVDTAKGLDIPLQMCSMEFGGYDGQAVHLHKTGVPTAVIGIPTRHVHGHNSIVRRSDYDNALELTRAVVQRLDRQTTLGLIPG